MSIIRATAVAIAIWIGFGIASDLGELVAKGTAYAIASKK